MKYAFIEAHRGQHAVATMCRVLGVSSSGYYAWRHRRRFGGKRARADQILLKAIGEVYQVHRGRYGSRRIWTELRTRGEVCSRRRVARLMRENGLEARRRRRYRITTQSKHRRPVAPNVLDRDFSAAAPNQKWVADWGGADSAESQLSQCIEKLAAFHCLQGIGSCGLLILRVMLLQFLMKHIIVNADGKNINCCSHFLLCTTL